MKRAAAAAVAVVVAIGLGWWLLRQAGEDARAPDRASKSAEGPLAADEVPAAQLISPSEAAAPSPEPLSIPAVLRPAQVLDGELSLDEDGTGVTGRVLDSQGHAVAGARLFLVEDGWGYEGDYFEFDVDRAVSDADGSFRLARGSSRAVDKLRLVVAAEGWPPWIGRVAPLGDGSDVVLGAVAPLRLRLLFEDGSPVAGALVRCEDPAWEAGGDRDEPITGAMELGRTTADGRLQFPVFIARRGLSITVRHPQFQGRLAAPLEEWRRRRSDFEWTPRVSRGAAFELSLSDWPASWPHDRETSLPLSLFLETLAPNASGELVSLGPTAFADPTLATRLVALSDGVAIAGPLVGAAFRVRLRGYFVDEVLIDEWRPKPGLTRWSCPTPQPPDPSKCGLVIDLAVVGPEAADAWKSWDWTLEGRDAAGHLVLSERLDAPGRVRKVSPFEGPLTLSIPQLGDIGVRRDVPASGVYRFELDAGAVRARTGGLRAEFPGFERPPRPEDVTLVLWPESSRETSAHAGLEAHGIPAGRYRGRVDGPGVAETAETVVIEPGRVAEIRAEPAPHLPRGLVRGRIRVNGDDAWVRLLSVQLRKPGRDEAAEDVGQRSFAMRVEPGHYHGTATLGRLPSPESESTTLHDVDMILSCVFNELPAKGEFECDVRDGETTDVVVDVDLGGLCALHLAAPADMPVAPGGMGSGTWGFRLYRAGDSVELSSGSLGDWPAQPASLQVAAGAYRLHAELWLLQPGIDVGFVAGQLDASFDVPAGAREQTVVLQRAVALPDSR